MRRFQAEPDHIAPEDEHVLVEEHDDDFKGVSFPDEYMEDLRGLLFLGDLREEVEYGSHTFELRTLREGEILRIGQLTKDYQGTDAELNARRLFTVAAAIESVDGLPLATSYKPEYDLIYEKANTVKQWYPSVIAFLYGKYIDIENASINIADALKK